MNYFSTAILSIIQGLTELLPISSSGHLLLASELINLKPSLPLLTLLHFPSAVAILIFYRGELIKTVQNLKLVDLGKFIIAIIPAGIVGVLAGDFIEEVFHMPQFIAFSLVLWGILMIFTEQKIKTRKKKQNSIPIVKKVSWKQALFIGTMQILALVPGTSRSGITTLAGVWTGLEKGIALDFSFIIGLPLLLGAFGFEFVKSGLDMDKNQAVLLMVLTFIVSYCALFLLNKMKRMNFLTIFGIYRIILSIGIISVLLF
ncbi:undecaprenyl-diphosphate phosphatase [Candidatus Dojkabacteria bacterium]|uniref:Undecaprenyl-diphosphatase n=1 Tax=Candidatus Dojkabacteria bacterium TaxID=2099670 RepID=A0A955I686_9BACT|nr:undecaprenyl-diphosphate phosphatase [Candidatus Dojkabacteria bacterium]MCB9790510.1 undecaprenyl-diphosphate phosphatase [Candidatus Nomurabacteria bacterium]